MSASTLVTTAVGASALTYLAFLALRVGRREPDIPPGPPTLPVLGNLHVFPTVRMHIKFTEWARTYGEIFSLKLVNGTVVVLNSLESVRNVFEQQGSMTSDRPPSTIARMVADDLHLGTINADSKWKSYNRAGKVILSSSAIERSKPVVEAEEFYGMVYNWVRLLESGAALDLVPALKYLPEVLAPWKVEVKKIRAWMWELYLSTVKDCEEREAKGSSNGCALETIRENAEAWGLTRPMVGFLGGALVEAGSDTSGLSMHNTVLLAMANPDAQRRAQEEIDRVVGCDRLPTYDDLARMPYVKAFILEVSRLKPTAPLGFAHAASADVMYNGYRIPRGTMIFSNLWNISRDPALFDDPDKFMPERFIEHPQGFGKAIRSQIEQQGSDDIGALKTWPGVLFGIGKRKCPGVHLAHSVLDLATVRLLWAFNFNKPRDPSGKSIDVDIWNDKPGVLGAPFPFDCDIGVRSSEHAEIIRHSYQDAAAILEPFEQELCEADREWVAASRVD
ncbi:hypothetical protein FS837_010669 [Tulasnella sp. UAMH 9824]|nr:hypothetical protein FS837_010669 [Tulasnella sp. UAMH 9824]